MTERSFSVTFSAPHIVLSKADERFSNIFDELDLLLIFVIETVREMFTSDISHEVQCSLVQQRTQSLPTSPPCQSRAPGRHHLKHFSTPHGPEQEEI